MKLFKPQLYIAIAVICWALMFQVSSSLAQSRTHNLGDYKLRIDAVDYINTNDVDPTGEWPQDHFRYATIVFYNSGHAIGKWIDSTGTEHVKEDNLYPVS
ncbi:MAG: hypothetical protein ONB32_17200, partial [candidate division KSB1 bacterium]|nr:hypothetical protein [candidate division KSB1 bacterium]